MLQFACFVVCAVVVSLSRIHAIEEVAHPEEFMSLVEECAKLHGYTDEQLNKALTLDGVETIKPCFWGCAFTKAGFLNGHGQYDLDSGLTSIKRFLGSDSVRYSRFERIARQCESVKDKAVNDGEAGCERGALAAACFMDQLQPRRV
nr:odorant-binding protein 28 [Peridroma saucia]